MSVSSELTELSTNISNAYTTIGTKGGTVPQNKNTSNLSSAINSIPSGGGDIVNGIIEQYKASTSTIDANTFVEFVNSSGNDTAISSLQYAGNYAHAVLIDTNKVFIAHNIGGGSQSAAKYTYLNGRICTIDNKTITAGTATTLISTNLASSYSKPVLIDTNKVFIAYTGGGGNYNLYGVVCTISGTTITAGTGTAIGSTGGAISSYTDVVTLDTNKVFIAHRKGGSTNATYLYGIVCNISGTTISKGTDTALVSVSNAADYTYATLIDTNKVFVAHTSSNNTSFPLNAIICTISGTTISKGTDTTLTSTAYSGSGGDIVTLDTNKVFIVHANNNTNSYLNGLVCTVSGTTITAGTDTLLNNMSITGRARMGVLDKTTGKVFIAYGVTSSQIANLLYGVIVNISNTTINITNKGVLINTANTSTTSNSGNVVILDDVRSFIPHPRGANLYLYGIVADLTVVATPSTTKIDGLTKTECTTSTAGDVWVLDV